MLPVGTIIPYAGALPFDSPKGGSNINSAAILNALIKEGWLPCRGQSVAVAEYPELYKIIRTIYGQGVAPDGKDNAGWFRVPDYRGRFLRGVNTDAMDSSGEDGSEQPRDPDATSRIAQSAGGWQGNAVGSVQDDALQYHVHQYQKASAAAIAPEGSDAFSLNTETPSSEPVAEAGKNTVRLSEETRGKNQYVHFLIKAF